VKKNPGWKCGFEIELMAPKGKSRETLARALANAVGGLTRRRFYPQSEIDTASKGKGFETLTLAFDVLDAQGNKQFTLADDVTLNADIDQNVVGEDGWYRVLSTQRSNCDLVDAQCDANAGLDAVLEPLAALFHTTVRAASDGLRIVDSRSCTIAVALPLAGDRERACELITRPFAPQEDARGVLTRALATAASEGFFVPKESATHIHFDGRRLQNTGALRNVVAVFHRFRVVLRERFATNPACVRLGPWPRDLLELVFSQAFLKMPWKEAARALDTTTTSKYCDFNLINLFDRFSSKTTFEVRILPTHLDADAVVDAALLFESLLERALNAPPLRPLPSLDAGAEGQVLLDAFLQSSLWSLTAKERAALGATQAALI
jgi:hypothetical protein